MSASISTGYTDTPISGVTSLTFPRGMVNFKSDFRIMESTADKATVTNLTSPIDRPEVFQWTLSYIKDVYAGSGIDPSVYAPSRRGVKVFCKVSDVISVTDATDPDFRVDLPVSAHLLVNIPASEYITSEMVQTLIGRVVSGYYETGSTATNRIAALTRGSLLPSDLK